MIKTKTWIAVLSLVFAACAALSLFFLTGRGGGTVAVVYLDGKAVRRVDLDAVGEGYTFTVESERGVNTIEVQKGRIRVADADCLDGVCVRSGWLDGGGLPIVCLPHRLVIKLERGGEFDSVSH